MIRNKRKSNSLAEKYLEAKKLDKKKQPKKKIPKWKTHSDISTPLKDSFYGKCGYCERPGYSIDHVKPKNPPKTANISPKECENRRWDWNNFVWACQTCQIEKGNKEGPFVDPCYDEPLEHLEFFPITGEVKETEISTTKGSNTVHLLNSLLLQSARRRKTYRILDCVDLLVGANPEKDGTKRRLLLNMLIGELNCEESYLGTIRQIFLDPDPQQKEKLKKLFALEINGYRVLKWLVKKWCLMKNAQAFDPDMLYGDAP